MQKPITLPTNNNNNNSNNSNNKPSNLISPSTNLTDSSNLLSTPSSKPIIRFKNQRRPVDIQNNNNSDDDNYQNNILFTWANENDTITKLLLFLGLIQLKIISKNTSHNASFTPPVTIKKSSKRTSKSKKSTKQQPTSSSNSKLKTRTKRHREKIDVNSVQYKLLHTNTSKLRKISKLELSKHIIPSSTHINKLKISEKPDGIWMMIHGFIFDVVGLIEVHPGGAECLLDCAGVDATRVFDDVGHSDIAWEMLENCCVGVINDLESSDESDVDEDSNKETEKEKEKEKEIDNQLDHADSAENNINETTRSVLIWNRRLLEILSLIILSFFGLLCFVQLQRKKWEQWNDDILI